MMFKLVLGLLNLFAAGAIFGVALSIIFNPWIDRSEKTPQIICLTLLMFVNIACCVGMVVQVVKLGAL